MYKKRFDVVRRRRGFGVLSLTIGALHDCTKRVDPYLSMVTPGAPSATPWNILQACCSDRGKGRSGLECRWRKKNM